MIRPDRLVSANARTYHVPQWYMDEVENVVMQAKRRLRPFGAFYTPGGMRPVTLVKAEKMTGEAATSLRFMGMYDPSASGMEGALTMSLVHQFKREERKKL